MCSRAKQWKNKKQINNNKKQQQKEKNKKKNKKKKKKQTDRPLHICDVFGTENYKSQK